MTNMAPFALIDLQIDAYRRRDIDSFVSYYSDKILIYRDGKLDPFVKGLGELRIYYQKFFDSSPNLQIEILAREIKDHVVIDHERIWGMRGDPHPKEFLVRYEIEGDKIASVNLGVRPMHESEVVGRWTLEKHGKFSADESYTPTSQFLMGKLIYANDRSMSVLILKREKAETLQDLIVYSGQFSIEGDKIFHHIEVAPNSSRRGTTELRRAELKGDLLILRTEKTDDGYFEIHWRRESSAGT